MVLAGDQLRPVEQENNLTKHKQSRIQSDKDSTHIVPVGRRRRKERENGRKQEESRMNRRSKQESTCSTDLRSPFISFRISSMIPTSWSMAKRTEDFVSSSVHWKLAARVCNEAK
jgi:hypothetical protein